MSLKQRSPNIYRQLHVHACLHTITNAMITRTTSTLIARAALAVRTSFADIRKPQNTEKL